MTELTTWQGVDVLSTEGEAIPITSLWRDQPAALVFLRHFG